MHHQNTSRKISDYLFQRKSGTILLSCIASTIAGVCLFLLSAQGEPSRNWPVFQQGGSAQLIRLMQVSYLTDPATVIALKDSEEASMASERERQLLVNWISKRYPVDVAATELFVSAAYLAANEIGLDPHLILAVMAIESSFNPEAESPVGAKGLMQVMIKVHSKRFEPHGGIKAAKDPVANIRVGSAILKEYVSRGGSVERGLKSYVGAAAYSHDFGYGAKVLAEYKRMKQVSRGKKVPTVIASKSTSRKLARADTKKSGIKAPAPEKTAEAASS